MDRCSNIGLRTISLSVSAPSGKRVCVTQPEEPLRPTEVIAEVHSVTTCGRQAGRVARRKDLRGPVTEFPRLQCMAHSAWRQSRLSVKVLEGLLFSALTSKLVHSLFSYSLLGFNLPIEMFSISSETTPASHFRSSYPGENQPFIPAPCHPHPGRSWTGPAQTPAHRLRASRRAAMRRRRAWIRS